MPRVLIITSSFPPLGICGSTQLGGYAKYLHRMGWDVRVLTPEVPHRRRDDTLVVNMPDLPVRHFADKMDRSKRSHGIRRVLARNFQLGIATYGAFPRGTLRNGEAELDRIVAEWRPDVIFASFVRPLAHRLGAIAHHRYGIPWVADFRDAMEQIAVGPILPLALAGERRVVASASHITANNRGTAAYLQRRHAGPLTILGNGVDLEETPPAGLDNPSAGPFTILHTGKIHANRSPHDVLAAVDELVSRGEIPADDIHVRLLGAPNVAMRRRTLEKMVRSLAHPELVSVENQVTHRQAIEAQYRAHLLLVLPGLVSHAPGNVPAKLFEYTAARRPILSTTRQPQPEIAELLDQYGPGLATASRTEMQRFILDHYRRWKQSGRREVEIGEEVLRRSSIEEITRTLEGVLRQVVDSSSSG